VKPITIFVDKEPSFQNLNLSSSGLAYENKSMQAAQIR
jgi:hypothetical protein